MNRDCLLLKKVIPMNDLFPKPLEYFLYFGAILVGCFLGHVAAQVTGYIFFGS